MRAWFDGYRLTRDFYLGDRAMRESGFDPSFRLGAIRWGYASLRPRLPEQPALSL